MVFCVVSGNYLYLMLSECYKNTVRPSKKKNMFLVRISIKKKRAGGRFFSLFIISYCMLALHIITFPKGYVGALRSNIDKIKKIRY